MDQQIPTPNKSKAMIWIIVIVILLFILFGGFFFWRGFIFDNEDEINTELENAMTNAEERFPANTNSQPINTVTTNTNSTTNSLFGAEIIGTWESDCLVPDLNSPWSEKHQFVIKTDGTAIHTRWSGSDHNCTVTEILITNYSYTILTPGQINLTDQELGNTIYDIYQISGETLKFGHGFQSPYPAGYDATQGYSSTNRFQNLNDYIIYNK